MYVHCPMQILKFDSQTHNDKGCKLYKIYAFSACSADNNGDLHRILIMLHNSNAILKKLFYL